MGQVLYATFLENRRVYRLAKARWQHLFEQSLSAKQYTFRPFLNEKRIDGNPMFTAYVSAVDRAVRIIQEAVEQPDDFFISAWMDTFPIDEDNPLNELVIALVLSEETLELAERLIVHWLVEGLGKKEMERVLEAELALLG